MTQTLSSPTETSFRSAETARLAGLSYRMLDYWIRTGVITPTVDAQGPGTQRRFSAEQVALLKMAARLRDGGVSLPQIRKAVAALDGARPGWLIVPLEDQEVAVVADAELLAELGLLGAALVVEVPMGATVRRRRARQRPSAISAPAWLLSPPLGIVRCAETPRDRCLRAPPLRTGHGSTITAS